MYQIYPAISPAPISFSRNPINFSWKLVPVQEDLLDLNFVLNIQVEVKQSNQQMTKSFALRPDAQGVFSINIASYIDAFLKITLPRLDDTIQLATQQTCDYSVSGILSNDYEQVASLSKRWFKALKGGLSQQQNDVDTFIHHNIISLHQPLSFPFIGQEVSKNDVLIVSALATLPTETDFHTNTQAAVASFQYRYQDHSLVWSNWEDYTASISVNYAQVLHAPFHVGQHIPSEFDSIKSVELAINLHFDDEDYTLVQDSYTINNTHNSEQQLLFPNSLGGFSSISLFQYDEKAYNYSKSQVKHIDLGQFLSKNLLQHTFETTSTYERAAPRFVTNALNQHELDRLRDLHFGRTAYILKGGKLTPVAVSSDNLRLTETDGMFNLTIAVEESIHNVNYTPDGTIVDSSVCPVPKYLILTQSVGNSVDVHFGLAVNQFEGKIELTNFTNSTTIIVDLAENEGVINVKTGSLNIHNVNTYGVFATLFTKCGDIFSSSLAANTTVDVFAKPSLPTLFANTYEGAGYRVLTFQTNQRNLLHTAALNNPRQEFNFAVFATSAAASSGTSAFLGNFQVQDVPNTFMFWMAQKQINYSPAVNFVGRDIITYYALAYHRTIPANMSALAQGKIYVNVEGTRPTSNIVNEAIYIRMTKGSNMVHTPEGMLVPGKLEFFSDPYGLQPLDLTGKGIIAYIDYTITANGSGLYETQTLNLSGTFITFDYWLIKFLSNITPLELDGVLRESTFYYIIL